MTEMFARLLISLLFILPVADKSPQEIYISQFSSLAVEEMYRSGVPASITLAQGLLESRYGLSELATKGNNHFGIKCHSDWKGKTMRVDDDRKNECFRVYKDPEQSFADHSDFLRYSPRYHFLFDYPVTDYKAWAYGLRKAGYATDPEYPSKLIRLVEEYNLARFDTGAQPEPEYEEPEYEESEVDDEKPVVEEKKVQKKSKTVTQKKQKQPKTATRKKRSKASPSQPAALPPPPSVLETPKIAANEDFTFSLSRKVYILNGVPFVYSEEGETYGSIAGNYNLFLKEILYFNDASADGELLPGTVVYIQNKKKQAVKGLEKYIVENDGESLRNISQQFAVRMSSILKMNGFSAAHKLREGDTIILR